MQDVNFQPVFEYVNDKTDELKAELASKEDISKLQASIDSYAKQELTKTNN